MLQHTADAFYKNHISELITVTLKPLRPDASHSAQSHTLSRGQYIYYDVEAYNLYVNGSQVKLKWQYVKKT
jgi:hypothetical protein